MAVDMKYGRVNVEREPGNPLGDDEPVVVFRARDVNLPLLLDHYASICASAPGASPRAHVDAVYELRQRVDEWQAAHPDLVKVPD